MSYYPKSIYEFQIENYYIYRYNDFLLFLGFCEKKFKIDDAFLVFEVSNNNVFLSLIDYYNFSSLIYLFD